MSLIVVSDTTALIHLSKINALHLLKALYSRIRIPQAVYDEVTDPRHRDATTWQVTNSEWIEVVQVRNAALVATLRGSLDRGESEAIVLAKELQADLLIMDEVKGRAAAKQHGLRVRGMVGILVRAKQAGHIPQIKPSLLRLHRSGFRMSLDLVNQALAAAGEAPLASLA